MQTAKARLLEQLAGRPIAVWGARITGMGLIRFLRSEGLSVVALVDSDPGFKKIPVMGMRVRPPSTLAELRAEHPALCVLVAVSIKESEIVKVLGGMGFSATDYVVYGHYSQLFYTIDITGACNLRCPSCAHGSSLEGLSPGARPSKGRMSLTDLRQVVDKIVADSELVTHLSLYSWGEPFLHKDLPDIVDYLHDKQMAVALSSNLSLDADERLKAVIRRGPEYLKVSLSGYFPEAYNQTHRGGDIHLVRSNLHRLRHYIDSFNVGTFVDVNYHLYRHNNGENLERMRQLCHDLGFGLSTTYALVMPLERVFDHRDGVVDMETRRLQQLMLVDIDEGIAASQGVEMEGCPYQTNQLVINWDRSVPVCCLVYGREGTTMAEDYLTSSLAEIAANKQACTTCSSCMARGYPAYNMGFNRRRWAEIAEQKSSLDQAKVRLPIVAATGSDHDR